MAKTKRSNNKRVKIFLIVAILLIPIIFAIVAHSKAINEEKTRNYQKIQAQNTYQAPQVYEISKQEAEQIGYNFLKGFGVTSVTVMNSYREGNFWNVMVGGYKKGEFGAILFEINAFTGKIEYMSAEGQRIDADNIKGG